jgi:hypothetical protein
MPFDNLRSTGAIEEYNRTRYTRVVDHSNTIQNQKAFEAYQALVNGFLKCIATTLVALERWRKTTGPVVRVW